MVLEERHEIIEWKKYTTIMIPKKNKQTEPRPIAMTDVSHKILMSLIGREREKLIVENKTEKF